jgi:Lon protease-like protein
MFASSFGLALAVGLIARAAPSPEPKGKQQMTSDPLQHVRVLPLRGTVLFSDGVLPLRVGREKTIRLIQEALRDSAELAVISQRDAKVESPQPSDLYTVGVLAKVVQFTKNGADYALVLQGMRRVRVVEWVTMEPYGVARLALAPRERASPQTVSELEHRLRALSTRVIASLPDAPPGAAKMVESIKEPVVLAEVMAANGGLPLAEQQAILEATSELACIKLVVAGLEKQAATLGPALDAGTGRPQGPGSHRALLSDLREVTRGVLSTMARSYGALRKNLVLEAASRTASGALSLNEAGLPLRVDLLTTSNGKASPLTHVSAGVAHERTVFVHKGGLRVTLGDMSWDSCHVAIGGDLQPAKKAVGEWYWKWFDKEGGWPSDEAGLHGVVHELTFDPDGASFDVDLGSAPVEAFEELLDVFSTTGVERVDFTAGKRLLQARADQQPR